MYSGYLTFAGMEIINSARTEAYVGAFLPGVHTKPMSGGLREFLGHAAYRSPALDGAPWYQSANPASARFYGLYPTAADGAENSTRTVDVTELAGDGVVHSKPRHAGREIRFTAVLLAADEEALSEGMAWLRNSLDPGECAQRGDCNGFDVVMLANRPLGAGHPNPRRHFYKVELLEGPRTIKQFGSKRASAVQVEFVLSTGIPWAYSPTTRVASVGMDVSTTTHNDPAGEDCSAVESAYGKFVNDPYFTAIQSPPAAPVVKPPNILDVSTWRRRTAPIPLTVTQRWGRTSPIVIIDVGSNDLQQLRLRFYRRTTNLQGCDYEGEFLVSYLPANCAMTLNSITREATVHFPNGVDAPGGHLLYGSDGLPPQWPTLSCRDAYTLAIDLMSGNSGITVTLDVAVRE